MPRSPHARFPAGTGLPVNGMTRRGFLRLMAAGGTAAAGGALLSGCTSSDGESTDVTLKFGGTTIAEPYRPIPSKDEQAKDINAKAYAEALQGWLDENPGVKLEHINLDVANAEALKTAIGGGTAPDMFAGNTVGNWSTPQILQVFGQGLVAEISAVAAAHGFGDKLNPELQPAWEFWQKDGRRWGLPWEYTGGGQGLYYRVDWLQEAGIEPPTYDPSWTWTRVREFAKAMTTAERKGIAWSNWALWVPLASAGHDVLHMRPAPKEAWHWRQDWTSSAAVYEQVIGNIRGMIHEDRAAIADLSYAGKDDALLDAFRSGKAGMYVGNAAALITRPSEPESYAAAIADKLGKPLDEVVGWIPQPYGDTGFFTSTGRSEMAMMSFRPDIDEDALDKAVGLHTHMMGPGLWRQMEVVYAETGDLRDVYSSGVPGGIPTSTMIPVFEETTAKLPGSAEEAWGEKIVAAYRTPAQLPPMPVREGYLPIEENPAPPNQAADDAISTWTFTKGGMDIRASLEQVQRSFNQAAGGFSSSVSEEDFRKGMTAYYGDLVAFLTEHAPDFHRQDFEPVYRQQIAPVLGQ